MSDNTTSLYSFRDRLILALVRAFLRVMTWLPLEWARSVGRKLGAINYWLDGRPRRVTERNIRLAYPELSRVDQEALIKSSMEEAGALVCEMGHVWLRPWAEAQSLVLEVEGAEHVLAAQAEGKGVIVLGPHLGNWEVLGLHLATLGDMVALFEPPQIASLGDLIHESRERSGGKLVPTTARGIADIVRSVKKGGISGILPDQVPDEENAGRNVPFMGVDCCTASLGCSLVTRSKAVALMGAAMRIPGGFRVRYVPPSDAIYSDDLEESLTAMNDEVEKLLRGWDNQYQWQYKRFRCRPTGPVDHYIDLMKRDI